VRQVHGRQREGPGAAVLRPGVIPAGVIPAGVIPAGRRPFGPLRGDLPGQQQRDQHDHDPASHDVDPGAAAVLAPDPHGRHDHRPGQRAGDEDLPAQLHQLV
jgi:hypothetical protein